MRIVDMPGIRCFNNLIMLKNKILDREYKLPIKLIIVQKAAKMFTLYDADQIQVLDYKKVNSCGKEVCPLIKLLGRTENDIVINPKEECFLKTHKDADGKPIFLFCHDDG